MRRAIKILIWLLGVFVLFSIVGFFVVPPVMKSVLTKKLSEQFHRQVSIGEIKVNPYRLTFSVKKVVVRERRKPETFVSLDEIYTQVSGASIFKRALLVKELRITGPYFNIVRNPDKSYNFSDILTQAAAKEEKPKVPPAAKKEEKKPFLFSVNNIVISGAHIEFFDGVENVQHSVKEMRIAVPFISNTPYNVNRYVQAAFSARINGAAYDVESKAKPFAEPLETCLDIVIKDLDLPKYMAYVPVKANFALLSGALDMTTRISFVEPKDKTPAIGISGEIALRNIAVDDLRKQPVLRLPSVKVSIASLEPLLKAARVSKVMISEPVLNVKREKNGSISLASLVGEEKTSPAKKDGHPKKGPSGAPPKAAAHGPAKAPAKGVPKSDEPPAFHASLDEFVIEKAKVSFRDLAVPRPVDVAITDFNVKARDLSTEKGKKSDLALSLTLNKTGSITATGPFAVGPFAADLTVDIKKIAIGPFQPYFTDKVKINTTSGHITTSGKAAISEPDKGGLKAKFTGKLLMADFASVDKINGDDFLKWKALSLSGMDVGYNPLKVHIGSVSIADFYARVTQNPDGTLSLKKIVEEEPGGEEEEGGKAAPAPAPGKEKAASPAAAAGGTGKESGKAPGAAEKDVDLTRDVTIGGITLQNGAIDFEDKAISPPYSVDLTEMTGRIGGFSLKLDERADVELRGKINNQVPLEILGKINPSRDNLFTDVTVRFKDLDLTAMSPYSGKYLGYKIAKGNLSVDLKYLIEKRKLDSGNNIVIDQLTLGDKVESPTAVKLPLGLAIALLRDRHGQINLDIPVSGSLDDPQFSVWKIVVKVLLNLITKAVTAPFALIGSLFGGGEELSYVEFDYGKSVLTNEGAKKIDTLVKALYERPALKLDMEGHVDVDRDRDALRTYLFNKKVKAQKLNALVKKGQPAIPVDDITVEPGEYERYLTLAYKAEKFDKPRNIIGLAKSLPVPEMEKLMYTNIKVSDGDLRTLAVQRTARVKDALLASGKVTADRLFTIEPKSLAPEKKEKAKDSRVDFKLK